MQTTLWVIFIIMIIFPIVMYWIQKRNLTYFKLHGRTPLEIERWLMSQDWFTLWWNNTMLYLKEEYDDDLDAAYEKAMDILTKGEYDKQTISSAFPWSTTKEGTEYWARAEYKFLKWYFGQYIDFHLISSKI